MDNHGLVKPTFCPYCGHEVDSATDVDDAEAVVKPGDLSLCIACGGAMEFDADFAPRVLSNATRESLPAELLDKLQAISRAIRSVV